MCWYLRLYDVAELCGLETTRTRDRSLEKTCRAGAVGASWMGEHSTDRAIVGKLRVWLPCANLVIPLMFLELYEL